MNSNEQCLLGVIHPVRVHVVVGVAGALGIEELQKSFS